VRTTAGPTSPSDRAASDTSLDDAREWGDRKPRDAGRRRRRPSGAERRRGASDLLVVPGGGWTARDEDASAWAEAQKGDVPRALGEYHAAGVRTAAVCTGAMLLAEAGVTDGRRAVTHASAIDELRESGAAVVDTRVVDDGDLLTAGGVTSGIDLALYLVEQEFGEEIADRVATVIEYERRYEVAGGEVRSEE